MKVVTVHLPETTLEIIKKLVELEFYPNVAEAIRYMVTREVTRELAFLESRGLLEPEQPEEVIQAPEGREGKKRMVLVSFKIPKTLLALLDAEVKKTKAPRSWLLRKAVTDMLTSRYKPKL
jgi:Arc/MetJ-type ribon-helix-helix transcriptional regulator